MELYLAKQKIILVTSLRNNKQTCKNELM